LPQHCPCMKFSSSKDYSPHPLSHDITLSSSRPFHHSLTNTCKAKKPPFLLLICSILHLELDRIAFIAHSPHSQLQLKPLSNSPFHKVHIYEQLMNLYTFWYQFHPFILVNVPNATKYECFIHIILRQEQTKCNIRLKLRILAITSVFQPIHFASKNYDAKHLAFLEWPTKDYN
jgi:hypothetical protein